MSLTCNVQKGSHNRCSKASVHLCTDRISVGVIWSKVGAGHLSVGLLGPSGAERASMVPYVERITTRLLTPHPFKIDDDSLYMHWKVLGHVNVMQSLSLIACKILLEIKISHEFYAFIFNWYLFCLYLLSLFDLVFVDCIFWIKFTLIRE